ncbi:MAG: hypothetical protein AAFU70_06310 [Planctomycetota bacterium]
MTGAAVISLGVLWTSALAAAGVWLLASAVSGVPLARPAVFAAGCTALAASQLVFTAVVADRLCPKAGRILGPWLELPTCVFLFAGLSWITIRAISLGFSA